MPEKVFEWDCTDMTFKINLKLIIRIIKIYYGVAMYCINDNTNRTKNQDTKQQYWMLFADESVKTIDLK